MTKLIKKRRNTCLKLKIQGIKYFKLEVQKLNWQLHKLLNTSQKKKKNFEQVYIIITHEKRKEKRSYFMAKCQREGNIFLNLY